MHSCYQNIFYAPLQAKIKIACKLLYPCYSCPSGISWDMVQSEQKGSASKYR